MPYIVTTRPAAEPPNEKVAVRARVLSRRAIAALDGARETVKAALEPSNLSTADYARMLPEQGGTVGPLPDGTVIEVIPASWQVLAAAARVAPIKSIPGARREREAAIIAAYNARQGADDA